MTWSDASIVYKAEHVASRSELRPSAVKIDQDGEMLTLEINPNHYFSEGQQSALSVSALFAASMRLVADVGSESDGFSLMTPPQADRASRRPAERRVAGFRPRQN
jgi:hypothetical protein